MRPFKASCGAALKWVALGTEWRQSIRSRHVSRAFARRWLNACKKREVSIALRGFGRVLPRRRLQCAFVAASAG